MEVKLEEITGYVSERIESAAISTHNYIGVENLLQNKQGKTEASSVPKNASLIAYRKDDILIGNIRPYLKKIWKADNNGGTNGDVLTIRIKKDAPICVNPDFLYYVLSSDKFFNYDNGTAKGAKMPRGDKLAVLQYKLIVPEIDEQIKIVDVLDRFDALCNDITDGLPAEIATRQKQYEFYRDRLLSFEEN